MIKFQDATKEIKSFVNNIYKSIIKKSSKVKPYIEYEEQEYSARIMVTSWFKVFETGRKPRYTTKTTPAKDKRFSSAFEERLYDWMRRRGKLTAKTEKGKINQAKSLRYFINKRGTKDWQKGSGKVVNDVYTSMVNEKTLTKLSNDMGSHIIKASSEIIDLKI